MRTTMKTYSVLATAAAIISIVHYEASAASNRSNVAHSSLAQGSAATASTNAAGRPGNGIGRGWGRGWCYWHPYRCYRWQATAA